MMTKAIIAASIVFGATAGGAQQTNHAPTASEAKQFDRTTDGKPADSAPVTTVVPAGPYTMSTEEQESIDNVAKDMQITQLKAQVIASQEQQLQQQMKDLQGLYNVEAGRMETVQSRISESHHWPKTVRYNLGANKFEDTPQPGNAPKGANGK